MDYSIFNVHTWSFFCMRKHTGVGHTHSKSAQRFWLRKTCKFFLCAWLGSNPGHWCPWNLRPMLYQLCHPSPPSLLGFTCQRGTWRPLCGSRRQLCAGQWPVHCWPHRCEPSSPPEVGQCGCRQTWLPDAGGTCSACEVGSLQHLQVTHASTL